MLDELKRQETVTVRLTWEATTSAPVPLHKPISSALRMRHHHSDTYHKLILSTYHNIPPGINTRHQMVPHENWGLEIAPQGLCMEGHVSMTGRGSGGGGGGAQGSFISSRMGGPH